MFIFKKVYDSDSCVKKYKNNKEIMVLLLMLDINFTCLWK